MDVERKVYMLDYGIYIFCWKVKGGVILAISDTKCRNITDFPSKTCIFENLL